MKKLIINLLALCCITVYCEPIHAQDCYNIQRGYGDRAYQNNEYEKAITYYEAAFDCAEVKNNKEYQESLQKAIDKCKEAIQRNNERNEARKREQEFQKYVFVKDHWAEGLMAVKLKDCNDKCQYGFIDRNAKLVIPCMFDSVATFSEGLCAVKLSDKYGFIDKKGNIVIEPKYSYAFPFKNKSAAVFLPTDKYKSMLIDPKGNIIDSLKFRPEYLSLQHIYEYAKITYKNKEYGDAFATLKAYENYKKGENSDDRFWLPDDEVSAMDQEIINMLGDFYFEEMKDYAVAILYWSSISEYNGYAEYRLADCNFYGKGYKQNVYDGISCLKKAVDLGSPEAMYDLGLMYYRGWKGFVTKDVEKGISLISQAAKLGNIDALLKLAELCVSGELRIFKDGLYRPDYKKAVHYLQWAAQQDSWQAINLLGDYYAKGLGVTQDLNKAVDLWLRIDAILKISNLYASGSLKEVNKEVVEKMEKRAASGQSGELCFDLGICYYYGFGVIKDYKKSVKYFAECVRSKTRYLPDFTLASLYLSWCYLKGYGVKKDFLAAQEFQWEVWQSTAYNIFAKKKTPTLDNCINKYDTYYVNTYNYNHDYDSYDEIEHYVNILIWLKNEGFYIINNSQRKIGKYYKSKSYGLTRRETCLNEILSNQDSK